MINSSIKTSIGHHCNINGILPLYWDTHISQGLYRTPAVCRKNSMEKPKCDGFHNIVIIPECDVFIKPL